MVMIVAMIMIVMMVVIMIVVMVVMMVVIVVMIVMMFVVMVMVMLIMMAVLMAVEILHIMIVILMGRVHEHGEITAVQACLGGSPDLHGESLRRHTVHSPHKDLSVRAEVYKRADRHISADTGRAFQI